VTDDPDNTSEEEPMTTATLPRKRTRTAVEHEAVTTPSTKSKTLVDVSCICGGWTADAPVRDALVATIYREHTDALAAAAKKSTTKAAPTRRAQATKAELTKAESLFAALFTAPAGDASSKPGSPIVPLDEVTYGTFGKVKGLLNGSHGAATGWVTSVPTIHTTGYGTDANPHKRGVPMLAVTITNWNGEFSLLCETGTTFAVDVEPEGRSLDQALAKLGRAAGPKPVGITIAGQLAELRAKERSGSTNIARQLAGEQADRYEAQHPLVRLERNAVGEWGWVCPVPTCLIGRADMATARVAKRAWQQHCKTEAGRSHPVDFVGEWPAEYPADIDIVADAVEVDYNGRIAMLYKVGARWAFECVLDGHGGLPHVEVVGVQYDAKTSAIMHARSAHGVVAPELPTDEDLLPDNPASEVDPAGLYCQVRDEAREILSTADENTDADLVAWAAGVSVVRHTVDVDRYVRTGKPSDLVSDYQGASLDNNRHYDAERSNGLRVYSLAQGAELGREDIVKVTWARVKKLIDKATKADPLLLKRIEQAGWRRGRELRKTLDLTPERKLAERTCQEVVAMLWDAARPGDRKAAPVASKGARKRTNRTAEQQPALFDLAAFMAEAQSALD
jgi:hypothetical protein